MTRRLARAIERDASLVSRAKMHLNRLLREDQGAAASDLEERRDIGEMYPLFSIVLSFSCSLS
jgi:hypothetical protein